MAPNPDRPLLSQIATCASHAENSPYFEGWKAYEKNPFHPINNPNGVIQMGLAENQLCSDLFIEWIKEHPEASICTSEGVSSFGKVANFQDYHGLQIFRKAVARFMGRTRGDKVEFDPDRVVMCSGATCANETIMFCLADPGDAFLVPTPYYPGFDRDLVWRTGARIYPVACNSPKFEITMSALEKAYEEAVGAGIKVKGILIANPSNPLGTVIGRETLKKIVQFSSRNNIHLVCDEIYAASVFSSPEFTSVSEIIDEAGGDHDLIHLIYSLSKDLGVPGFRVGIIYSYNDKVKVSAMRMASFGMVSTQTQHLLSSMLLDEEFVERILVESRRRLEKRHEVLTSGLLEVGIPCLRSNAGLYCWMDLRGLLKEGTVEGELELWKVIVEEVRLNVSPGSAFHCAEPGWFRVCFANVRIGTMEVALRRIREFVGEQVKKKKKKRLEDVVVMGLSGVIMIEEGVSAAAMPPGSGVRLFAAR